ncbi:MAG: hypothetical protein AB1589_21220 [Cyanobacteriota bacterium]
MSEKSDCSQVYQQALDDFGITQLLLRVSHYMDADFNAQLMHLEEHELDRLAAILIQRLTNSLNGKLIASYLNAIRYGDSHLICDPTQLEIVPPSTSVEGKGQRGKGKGENADFSSSNPQFKAEACDPFTNFPQDITPRYQEGDRIRWRPLDHTTDWGMVMGRFYARHQGQWAIYYLIWLDSDSPSAAWTVTDTAWEDDLEPNEEHSQEAYSTHCGTHPCTSSLSELPLFNSKHFATFSPAPPSAKTSPFRQASQQNTNRWQAPHNTFVFIHKSLHTSGGNYCGERQTTTPRALTQRELDILALYSQCQLGLTPMKFYAKWSVSYDQLAGICSRSTSTVQRWFSRGRNYRRPQPADLRHLAIMDFLLEHFEEMPAKLINLMCPQTTVSSD